MKIEKKLFDTHASLSLKGDFETDDAELLLDAIEDLRDQGVTRVSANLRMVKYMNSTALGTMVKARQLLRDEEGDLVIVRPSPMSREIISKIGLDSVVPMFDDEDSAISYLTEAGSTTVTAGASQEPLEERLGPTAVVFSFPDSRSELFKGRTRFGIATIEAVDAKSIVFIWDPLRHGLDSEETSQMFEKGSSIQTKFKIDLIRKEHFFVDGTIDAFGNNRDGTVIVSAKWSGIKGADASALSRFTKDMAYLKKQIPKEPRSQ